MVKQYELTAGTRRIGRIMSWMARRGIGKVQLLTTTGRKSGEPRSVPVSPIEVGGVEYVVSPYGEVGWVHNVRANPSAELRHGSQHRRVRLEEAQGDPAASAVAAYHQREGYARQYMDVPEAPTLDDFRQRASLFPVFSVTEPG
jgi:deazaflavin-dependent oxidoreductase (nitroreductase family)